ncbi:unnamed protein product [Closterium sp. NIES-54]
MALPGGKLVAICTDLRTGEHLATFNRRPGSGLYTLTTESAVVAESGQVAASVEVAASCSYRLLTRQTLLWHHCLGHPSLQRFMACTSVSLSLGFPGPCPRFRGHLCRRAFPASRGSSVPLLTPPTTTLLQTLHMDVWGQARVRGQGGKHYFLLVVDDYTRYTTVFPLQSKAEVRSILIRWIRAVRRQLSASFQQDLLVLQLHYNQNGGFSSGFLEDFYGAEGIRQTFTILASAQRDGFADRRIGLVMETSPTLRWTGEVGDASAFRGPAPLVVSQVDPSPLVEPVEVSSYTSGPAEGGDPTPAAIPVAEHSGAVGGGAFGGADSGGAGSWGADFPLGTGGTGGAGAGGPGTSRQEALSPWQLREWAVQWGSPGGGASRLRAGGAGTAGAGGAGTAGARGSDTGGTGVAGAGGIGAPRGSGGASPGGASAGVPGVGHAGGTGTGGTGAVGGTGGAGFGGASAGVPGVFRAGGTGTRGTGAAGGTGGAGPVGASAVVPRAGGTGGADTRGATRGTGVGGASRQESLSPQQLREWTVRWGGSGGGAGGTGSGGAVTTGAGGSGGATTQPQQSVLRHLLSIPPAAIEFSVAGTTPPLLFPPTDQSQPQLLLGSPLLAPTPNTEVTKFFSEHREPETRPSTPVRGRPVVHLVRTASPTVTRLLANVVTDPSFESTAAFFPSH